MATQPSLSNPLFPSLTSYGALPTAPQTGSGAYGAVPGATTVAPNTYTQVNDLVPGGLNPLTSGVASNIQSEIAGQVPGSVQSQLEEAAATQGVASGAPGSGLATNNLLESLGLNSEALTQKGTADYLSFLTGVGSTTTNPALATDVAQSNATLAAAPNPTAAADQLQKNYQQQLVQARGGYGAGYSTNPSYAGFTNPNTLANSDYASNVASNTGGGSDPYYTYSFGGNMNTGTTGGAGFAPGVTPPASTTVAPQYGYDASNYHTLNNFTAPGAGQFDTSTDPYAVYDFGGGY